MTRLTSIAQHLISLTSLDEFGPTELFFTPGMPEALVNSLREVFDPYPLLLKEVLWILCNALTGTPTVERMKKLASLDLKIHLLRLLKGLVDQEDRMEILGEMVNRCIVNYMHAEELAYRNVLNTDNQKIGFAKEGVIEEESEAQGVIEWFLANGYLSILSKLLPSCSNSSSLNQAPNSHSPEPMALYLMTSSIIWALYTILPRIQDLEAQGQVDDRWPSFLEILGKGLNRILFEEDIKGALVALKEIDLKYASIDKLAKAGILRPIATTLLRHNNHEIVSLSAYLIYRIILDPQADGKENLLIEAGLVPTLASLFTDFRLKEMKFATRKLLSTIYNLLCCSEDIFESIAREEAIMGSLVTLLEDNLKQEDLSFLIIDIFRLYYLRESDSLLLSFTLRHPSLICSPLLPLSVSSPAPVVLRSLIVVNKILGLSQGREEQVRLVDVLFDGEGADRLEVLQNHSDKYVYSFVDKMVERYLSGE